MVLELASSTKQETVSDSAASAGGNLQMFVSFMGLTPFSKIIIPAEGKRCKGEIAFFYIVMETFYIF